MKSFLTAGIIALSSTQAFATTPLKPVYYSCDGVGGVEEHVAAINLEKGIATFFDNDSYSYLKLTGELSLESNPPQRVLTFEGPDASYDGTIKVEFNETKRTVFVNSLNPEQVTYELGSASCKVTATWAE